MAVCVRACVCSLLQTHDTDQALHVCTLNGNFLKVLQFSQTEYRAVCRLKYLVTARLEIVTPPIWRSRSSLTNFNLKSLNATDSERPRAAENPTASCCDFTCTSKRQFFHAGGDPDLSYLWCVLSKTYLLKLWSCRLFYSSGWAFSPPFESRLSHCVNVTRSSPRTRSDARALFMCWLRRQKELKSRRLCFSATWEKQHVF